MLLRRGNYFTPIPHGPSHLCQFPAPLHAVVFMFVYPTLSVSLQRPMELTRRKSTNAFVHEIRAENENDKSVSTPERLSTNFPSHRAPHKILCIYPFELIIQHTARKYVGDKSPSLIRFCAIKLLLGKLDPPGSM
jgi:hypothetical protein